MNVSGDNLSPVGSGLYFVARLLGARVTSTYRTEEENADVGGSPVSKHLTGDAIDIAADSPPLAVNVLSVIAHGGLHKKGTAPHYHFEATPLTALLLAGAILGVARLTQKAV